MSKVKIHTETGVGSRYREGHFKKIDYAKKGDGDQSSITVMKHCMSRCGGH